MNVETIAAMTIGELCEAYRRRATDPVEVLELTHFQIDQVNGAINALYDEDRVSCRAQAEASARRWRRGEPAGALDGVPVTIKDSVHATGMRWHHGSAAHGAGVLGTKDAPPTQRLKAAAAIIIAKSAMPDYGMSASGVSSFFGLVRNPWNLAFSPGGSSAGAGASLAAGIGMMSVGSDLAGSVRLPASHCGLVALKPTQGMVPHTPASDVRSAGPMARHAADLEPLLRTLGGVHADDRFSLPVMEPAASYEGARVGVCGDFGFGPPVEEDVIMVLGQVADALSSLPLRVEPLSADYCFDAYLSIDDSFKLRAWREYATASPEERDATPVKLIAWFSEAADWSLAKAAEFEAGIARGVARTNCLFDTVDFLLTPVMPVVNFPAENLGPDETVPLRHCTFTAPFNQSGHPAVALLGGVDRRGLPVGIQLVARRCDDIRLLRLATALEAVLRGHGLGAESWPLLPRGAPACEQLPQSVHRP